MPCTSGRMTKKKEYIPLEKGLKALLKKKEILDEVCITYACIQHNSAILLYNRCFNHTFVQTGTFLITVMVIYLKTILFLGLVRIHFN